MDKIIFPSGTFDILKIDFPNGSKICFDETLQCEKCKAVFTAKKLFEQHASWEREAFSVYEPQSREDFLYRQCPICKEISRVHEVKRGDIMDMSKLKKAQKAVAPEFIDIGRDEFVELEITNAELYDNNFGNPAFKFRCLTVNGEAPLNPKAKWDVGAGAIVRIFNEVFIKDPENAEKYKFKIKIKRTGEGNKTRYEMEILSQEVLPAIVE